MKAGISNIWILGLMVVFLLCFAAYITVSINYTASFKMKNEVISIIEKHKGITNTNSSNVKSTITGGTVRGNVGTLQTINLYLKGNTYTAKGDCNNEINSGKVWYGVTKLTYKSVPNINSDVVKLGKNDLNKKFYYCFAKFAASRFKGAEKNKYVEYRYKYKMFFRFDVPALSEFQAIRVDGTTRSITDVQDVKQNWHVNYE